MAGLWSAGLPPGRYLVAHLSGGTTEIIDSDEVSPGKLQLDLLGGSTDLNAGQFIDRLGLLMGLAFPAGPELEILARGAGKKTIKLPVSVNGSKISFSGPASHAERLLKQGCRKEDLARAIEICIADSLVTAVRGQHNGSACYCGLLAVGGVTANLFIRGRLISLLDGWKLHFAQPQYAADNAVGLAVQVARRLKNCE